MKYWNGPQRSDFDAIVVGSGASGLMAAATAAHAGKRLLVLEKSRYLGGTSAISGGTLWVPNNRCLRDHGLSDSREAAMTYLDKITRGHTPDDVLEAFVDYGPEMLDFAADNLDLRFESVVDYPDYRPDLDGSMPGGRSLDPHFYDTNLLGELREALRPDTRLPFTMQEYEQWVAFTRFPWEELRKRADAGLVARGSGVVAPLLNSARKLGVTFVTEAPVDRLIDEHGRVTGVRVGEQQFAARDGVVLASGGFEWNDQMVKEFVGGPILARCSPPHNTGDGIRMATRLGARLGNMREAWWAPMTIIPGDNQDGVQTGTLLRFERQGPGSIIVNKDGNRFVNESQNYNDMTRAFHAIDPVNHSFAHLPAYVVIDQEYLDLYGLLTHRSGAELPAWLRQARTLDELGVKLGVPAGALAQTVERFNTFARAGRDQDFARGDNAYDRYWGDSERPYSNPSLAPLERGPYYALEIVPGAFGTNGGLVTDGRARVLNAEDQAIPGLYAAGNATAHPMGGGYAGAGATLGPGMTMGYLAGKDLAEVSAASPHRATQLSQAE